MPQKYPLTSFSLTHVEFNPADPLSFLFAFITLSPLALIVSYVTIILARREVAAINMFVGQLICEVLNFGLKRWIKENRPGKPGKGYGMPSSHAQFMAYFATFAILYLYTRITFRKNSRKFPISLGLIGLFAAVSYSRIYLNYHTPKQVIVGSFAGALFAIAWFVFVENILRPFGIFKFIVNSRLAGYFYLRDSSDIEDIVRIEYMNWLELNKISNKKATDKVR